MSTFIKVKPPIAQNHWHAIEEKDLDGQSRSSATMTRPALSSPGPLPGGFDAGIHGALELFGIAKRWPREPCCSLNGAEMEKLEEFFRNLWLL